MSDDYGDGWLYAAAMRIWHEVEKDTHPREVVRIMRDDLHLVGGNPDDPTVSVPPGRCGALAPAPAGARVSASCDLRAGHAGQHEGRTYPPGELSQGYPVHWDEASA